MKSEPLFFAKLFLILCVIFSAGTIFGVVGYLAMNKAVKISQPQVSVVQKPTQTPTPASLDISNWQTYTNEQYGFELKYPKEWSLTNNPFNNFEGINSVISLTSPDTLKEIEKPIKPDSRGETASDDIFINYYSSLKDYADIDVKNLDEFINEDSSITKIGEVTIGGVKAVDIWSGGEGAHYAILIEKDTHLYEIFFSNDWKGREGLTDTENQILYTFKFLN